MVMVGLIMFLLSFLRCFREDFRLSPFLSKYAVVYGVSPLASNKAALAGHAFFLEARFLQYTLTGLGLGAVSRAIRQEATRG